ncbi:hypothetical protein NKH49_05085 [Mesorhizobium sp. M1088]|uniref:hypothetical protein n=1 Tax=Mesorhizobium sp. M1088 TaxID=2957056 RepID=UPI003337C58E
MRKAWLLTLAIMPTTSAFAANEDFPVFPIIVQNFDRNETLSATCNAPSADGMRCQFKRISISKPDAAEAPQRIEKLVGDLLKTPVPKGNECDAIAQLLTAVQTGNAAASSDITDKQEFQESWRKQSPVERADQTRLVQSMFDFCKSRNPPNADAMARAVQEFEGNTCTITTDSFERNFKVNNSTKKWQSTVQANDPCGTITYSELAKPDDADSGLFWNYTTKEIITNPTGTDYAKASCSTHDQTEHRYTWKTGKFYADCRYIQITH